MLARNPEYKEAVERIFTNANFIRQLGIRLENVEPGACETTLEITPMHKQHLDKVHGGVLVTLAGHTATGAATSLLEAGTDVVAAEFKINILRAVSAPKIFCRAQVLKSGKKLLVAEGDVFDGTDAKAKMVAKTLFTFIVLDGEM